MRCSLIGLPEDLAAPKRGTQPMTVRHMLPEGSVCSALAAICPLIAMRAPRNSAGRHTLHLERRGLRLSMPRRIDRHPYGGMAVSRVIGAGPADDMPSPRAVAAQHAKDEIVR